PEHNTIVNSSLLGGGFPPLFYLSPDTTPLTSRDSDLSYSDPAKAAFSSEESPALEPISPAVPAGEKALLLDSDESLPPLFPTPKRTKASKWLWLGLIVSFAVHTGLMLLPTGEQSKPVPPKDASKQVRITQLPKLMKTVVVPKKAARSTVKPLNRTVTRPLPPPLPKPPGTPKQSQAGTSQAKASTGSTSWEDFPLYPGAQQGCFNLAACLRTGDGVGQVADYYIKELTAKKYQFKASEKTPDRQVLQVSRNGQSQFLSLIKTEGGTVIVLSDAPRSLEDLKKAVEVPPEVSAILSNLDAQNAEPSNFAQPDLFYTKAPEKGLAAGAWVPKAEIRNISLVSGFSYDTMMDEFFRSNLQNNDFEVTDLPQAFGGGKVYKVTKGGLTLYLNLVPTQDNSGTLVVTWKDQPK
ncbi:MAG TPA: hypothetical protein V6C46_07495, partial [Coleofasciculaceae cyanobacterium]